MGENKTTITKREEHLANESRLQVERDAALAQVERFKREGGKANRMHVAEKDALRAERDVALAQVEVLRTIRSLCRGCLQPMKEHPPGPPCPPFLPGPLRAAGSALFRLVDAALYSTTSPRPKCQTCLAAVDVLGECMAARLHTPALDANPDANEGRLQVERDGRAILRGMSNGTLRTIDDVRVALRALEGSLAHRAKVRAWLLDAKLDRFPGFEGLLEDEQGA